MSEEEKSPEAEAADPARVEEKAPVPGQTKGPAGPERPTRLLGLFSSRPLGLEEVPRLIELCSEAYGEEQAGASLTLLPRPTGATILRIEALPGTMLKESELVMRVHAADDPDSDAMAVVDHMSRLDGQIGSMTYQAIEGYQSYVALIGTRLREQGRIRSFLNAGALIGSALGAVFVDPAAVMVTRDPGEWAEAAEQSLEIEGAMAAMQGQAR